MMQLANLRPYLSALVFSTGLLVAAGFALAVDGTYRLALAPGSGALQLDWIAQPRATHRGLTAPERSAGHVAWQYFTRNTQDSGLVNSADGYASATIWDQG